MTRKIRSEAEYEQALYDAEFLISMDPEPGSQDANTLELLTEMLEEYENRMYPIESPQEGVES